MLGAGFQMTRGRRGDDPYYSSGKARRSYQNSSRVDQLRRAQSDVSNGRSTNPKENPVACWDMEREKWSRSQEVVGNLASEAATSRSSNLERFMESVTPLVPAQHLSKSSQRERRGSDVKAEEAYFELGDVWESFAEWSAYGAGVPLILNNKDRVVQYYVPSLSAIQIYAHPHALAASLRSRRRAGEESDSDFQDSSSERSSSSDSESEREQTSGRMEDDPISLTHPSLHPGDSSSDDSDSSTSPNRLIFEYLERDLPYIREPLADKVSDLASRFPELKALRSCDILPSSWFSVAWYPIYRIPTGPTLKDLGACFLTYHSLSGGGMGVTENEQMKLPVFGLASYKLGGSVWTPSAGNENQLVNTLFQAADGWLRSHQVNHPDFIFFCRR